MLNAKLGFLNFWRQRRRNAFTLLSIAIGTSSLICLGGYVNRWEYRGLFTSVYFSRLGTVSIYKKDGLRFASAFPKKYTLNPDEQMKVRSILGREQGIEYIGGNLVLTGLAGNGCQSYPFEVKAFDPQLEDKLRKKDGVLKWISDLNDYQKGQAFSEYPGRHTIGLALGLAKLLGKKTTLSDASNVAPIHDFNQYCKGEGVKDRIAADPSVQLITVAFDGQIGALDADVAYLYSTGSAMIEDTKMAAPLATIQELFNTRNVSSMSVYYHDHDHAREKARRVQRLLREGGLDVEVYDWFDERLNPMFSGAINFLYTMSGFFGLLILTIVVLSVINLTTMNVLERMREIGTLKALGFQQGMIAQIFLAEGVVVASIGCALGLGIALAASSALNNSGIMFLPPGSSAPIPLLVIPDLFVSALVVGPMFVFVVLASFLTSHKLSKRSCLDLLTDSST